RPAEGAQPARRGRGEARGVPPGDAGAWRRRPPGLPVLLALLLPDHRHLHRGRHGAQEPTAPPLPRRRTLPAGPDDRRGWDGDGRGTCKQVASLIRQGAAALEAVHGMGILHRDIKPENFICTPTETGFRAKLIDFGIAKSMDLETGVTRVGIVLGTPAYMSPE